MTSVQFAPRTAQRREFRYETQAAPRRFPPIESAFARDVLAGLSRPRKSIPCTWLYDRRGAALFEQITRLAAYYPARAETAILESCAAQIAAAVGPGAVVVEVGSGSSRKTPLLLAALDAPSAYVPIDISAESLAESLPRLQAMFPSLPMHPIVGDIALAATLAPLRRSARALACAAASARPWARRVGFIPGSTIGNFVPDAAVALLTRLGQTLGGDALLVVGVDSMPDRSLLMPAYDDAEGVTAAFNQNLLARINRELEGDFDPRAFRHEARFDADHQRVEMHLVARTWDTFEVLGRRFGFAAGESIHTESWYKYSRGKFELLARRAGWVPLQYWTDARSRFAVHVLERAR